MKITKLLLEFNDFSNDVRVVKELRTYMEKFDWIDCEVRAMRDNDINTKTFIIALKSSKKRLFIDVELVRVNNGTVSCFDFKEQKGINNLSPDGEYLFGAIFAYDRGIKLKYNIRDFNIVLGLMDSYKETGPKPLSPEEQKEKDTIEQNKVKEKMQAKEGIKPKE